MLAIAASQEAVSTGETGAGERPLRQSHYVAVIAVEPLPFRLRSRAVNRIVNPPSCSELSLVFEHPPAGFDQGIGVRDIDASQSAMKQPRTDEFIDRPVEVLSATVGQHRGRTVLQTLRGGEQDFGGDARIEGRRDLPSQDAA